MVLFDTQKATNGQGEGGSRTLALVQPPSTTGDAPEGPKPSDPEAPKRGPGRPPGSKNRPKADAAEAKPSKKDGAKKAAKKKAGKVAAKKTAAKKPTKVEARAAAKVAERKAAATGGDVDADAHLQKIQKAFGRYNRAKATKAQTGKTCGENLKAAEAAFQNAVEAPLDATKVELEAIRGKLVNVEMRWQELSDTKAGNIEEKKHARDALEEARENLARVIENSQQLEMFDGE